MKHISHKMLLCLFSSIYVYLFSFFIMNSIFYAPNMIVFALGNETDHLALLKFRESISSDPHGIFLSWNTSTHFCNWYGITCNPMLLRVTKLNLRGCNLKGPISPYLSNLSYMIHCNLEENNLYGEIPQELGRLSQLQNFSVGVNSLEGQIPTNWTGCINLKRLVLSGNNLTGKIPIGISSLGKLLLLGVNVNQLTGRIPSFIGNLSSLVHLRVAYNNFEGDIPKEICHLKSLTRLILGVNKLSGTFPSCLYNISSLTQIVAPRNQFNGSLPPNMFHTLPNLQLFLVSSNQLSGTIPPSITNASTLSMFSIAGNLMVGQVPSLGKLPDLEYFDLAANNLGNNSTNGLEFLKPLTNCSNLQVLSVFQNNFGGHLPNFLGNLSAQLSELYLGSNQISGEIPAELGNLVGLTLLMMENNRIDGVIPKSFSKFQNMQLLELNTNKLSGGLETLGNLSQLFHLGLGENMFKGNIPPSIENCQKLQYLDLAQNHFTGSISLEVFNLSSLTNLLDLSQNSLSGSIPEQVGMLKHLDLLDVSDNHLSSDIPGTIGECIMLEYLYLQGNSLQGTIPYSLASLKSLKSLDLSRNRLSGSIPHVLQNLSYLEYFNTSFNMLDGEVPTGGVFQNASGLVVIGNNKLCGGILELHLPPCLAKGKKHTKLPKFKVIVVVVSVVVFLLILSILLTIYWVRKKSKKPSLDSSTTDQVAIVSYQSLYNGTNGFSTTNLIGSGNFSSVYKGTLELEDKVVAIKVLNMEKMGASKSFIVECNALKNIKHRNVVQILTCCSSIDYQGQEFKALIFEYMSNGSLDQWLHSSTLSQEHQRTLSLDQRLNIMIDVANALHYLHHECEQSIVHCDLKPSNVLLDNDMVAHVSDFGIARFLSTINGATSKQTSTIGIKGTVGYAPPEYGMGSEVSINGDMYSFGILMLEMLTGRRPTDEIFKDCQNLHNFVENSFVDNLLLILDPSIVPKYEEATIEEENSLILTPNVEKCLVSLSKIGLACSMESPKERMNIMDVTRELSNIRKDFLIERASKNEEYGSENHINSVDCLEDDQVILVTQSRV